MTDLSHLPAEVRESALAMASSEGEALIGWRTITKPHPTDSGRVVPDRYLIATDNGFYEAMPDGTFVRASSMHKFYDEGVPIPDLSPEWKVMRRLADAVYESIESACESLNVEFHTDEDVAEAVYVQVTRILKGML